VSREAGGGGRPHCTQRAWGGLDCRLGAGHGEERTSNMYRMVVTLEVSKLSGWLNADACCQDSKGGHAVRSEGVGQQTGATASSVQGRARLQIGGRTGVDRTRNIRYMVVTLDVFQLEMSALKFFKAWKSSIMSVMAETSQSAMGPHFAVAAVGLAL